MENFEVKVRRIALLIGYNIPLNDIRDKIIADGCEESVFFFAYKAAEMILKDN